MSKITSLKAEKRDINKKIKSLPKGRFWCTRNSSWYKWIYSDGHTRRTISKKDRAFAEKMALKNYYNARLVDIDNEINALSTYDAEHTEVMHLISNPELARLLAPYFQPANAEYSTWMHESYPKCMRYPEHKKYLTSTGEYVRSKSEAMIYDKLMQHQIPFRYEWEQNFAYATIAPDFTLKHPKTGQIIIWEHFGLTDDLEYRENAVKKIQHYMDCGYIFGVNLIITSESAEYPLTNYQIEHVIAAFLT